MQKATRELGFSMAFEPLVGSLLRTLAASKRLGVFLEIGTGTGIGTAKPKGSPATIWVRMSGWSCAWAMRWKF